MEMWGEAKLQHCDALCKLSHVPCLTSAGTMIESIPGVDISGALQFLSCKWNTNAGAQKPSALAAVGDLGHPLLFRQTASCCGACFAPTEHPSSTNMHRAAPLGSKISSI